MYVYVCINAVVRWTQRAYAPVSPQDDALVYTRMYVCM